MMGSFGACGGKWRLKNLIFSFPTHLESSHGKLRMLMITLSHRVKSGHHAAFRPNSKPFIRLLDSLQTSQRLRSPGEDLEVTAGDSVDHVTGLMTRAAGHRPAFLPGPHTPLSFYSRPPLPLGFCTCHQGPCLVQS